MHWPPAPRGVPPPAKPRPGSPSPAVVCALISKVPAVTVSRSSAIARHWPAEENDQAVWGLGAVPWALPKGTWEAWLPCACPLCAPHGDVGSLVLRGADTSTAGTLVSPWQPLQRKIWRWPPTPSALGPSRARGANDVNRLQPDASICQVYRRGRLLKDNYHFY